MPSDTNLHLGKKLGTSHLNCILISVYGTMRRTLKDVFL